VIRTTDLAQAVADALFSVLAPGESLYAVLDAARNPEIAVRLRAGGTHHDCLYQGPTAEALWFVAPYLARCERDSPFFSWLTEFGWGQSWGIFAAAAVDLASLRQHFRKLLLVKMEDDEADFYFRFYDPRVLRSYLPTCTSEEAVEFFGPIRAYVTEDEQAASGLSFEVSPEGVASESLPLNLQ
jgi:hypothetical protein